MEDMSPEPPLPADRPYPATGPHADRGDALPGADPGAPRRRRHTAKRTCGRLVEERASGPLPSCPASRAHTGGSRGRQDGGDGCLGRGRPASSRPATATPGRASPMWARPGAPSACATGWPGSSAGRPRAARACPRRRHRGRMPRSFPPSRTHRRTGGRCRSPRSGNGEGPAGDAVGLVRRAGKRAAPACVRRADRGAPFRGVLARDASAARLRGREARARDAAALPGSPARGRRARVFPSTPTAPGPSLGSSPTPTGGGARSSPPAWGSSAGEGLRRRPDGRRRD